MNAPTPCLQVESIGHIGEGEDGIDTQLGYRYRMPYISGFSHDHVVV